jgi:ABC-type transport system involved in cytochrome c biogenesis ATPase subunit
MKKERQGILQNEMLTYERSERFIFQRVSILFSETPCLSAEGKFCIGRRSANILRNIHQFFECSKRLPPQGIP